MPNAAGVMTAAVATDTIVAGAAKNTVLVTVQLDLEQWKRISHAFNEEVTLLDQHAAKAFQDALPTIPEVAGIMDKPETSVIDWHRLPDKPGGGEEVILEIEGKRGRSNRVVSAVYWDDSGHWAFDDGFDGACSVEDDRVVRWARFPEPSWKEEP